MDDELLKIFLNYCPDNNYKEVSFKELTTASINRLWIVYAGKSKWVLKKCNHDYSRTGLSSANKIIHTLHNKTIDTFLISNKDNQYFLANKDAYFSLSHYHDCESRVHLNDKKTLRECVFYLKRIHSMDMKNSEKVSSSEFSRGDVCSMLFNNYAVKEYLNESLLLSLAKDDKSVEDLFEVLEKIDIDTLREHYSSLSLFISHGEFQNQNVFFNSRSEIYAIDWDNISFRPRIIDVMTLISFFCREKRGGFDLDLVSVKYIINSFELSRVEIEILPKIAFLYFLPTTYMINKFIKFKDSSLDWYVGWAISGALNIKEQLQKMVGYYNGK